jgi:hypothetical protein
MKLPGAALAVLDILHWFIRLRVWLALLAITQGVIRIGGGTAMVLTFGNISIGWFMLAAGLFVLATYRRRLLPVGRVAAVALAWVYGLTAVASVNNLATCSTAALICAAMLAEAGSAQSDC